MTILILILFWLFPSLSYAQGGFYSSEVSRYQSWDHFPGNNAVEEINEDKYVMGFVPNGIVKVGEYGGQDIVYCIGTQNTSDDRYLGISYNDISQDIWKEMLWNFWYSGDEYVRGSMQEWKDASKPTKQDSWHLKYHFFGVEQPLPIAQQLLDLEIWEGQMPP